MKSIADDYLPFSQRNGLQPIPPQMKVGEASDELRRLIYYYIGFEIQRGSGSGFDGTFFKSDLRRVATDFHVLFDKQSPDTFRHSVSTFQERLQRFIQAGNIGLIFDLVEFFLRHPRCSEELKNELASAFVTARAAYRVIDNSYIVAIGTEQQAAAFVRAIGDTEATGGLAARRHLLAAGGALRNADWAGCIRESIHAVEAVAVRLAPEATTLGAALKILEQRGHLHGSLKAAFGSLYGYSSDEEGVRHALVFSDEARVDEADALFMLGACASFVSYLLARRNE